MRRASPATLKQIRRLVSRASAEIRHCSERLRARVGNPAIHLVHGENIVYEKWTGNFVVNVVILEHQLDVEMDYK